MLKDVQFMCNMFRQLQEMDALGLGCTHHVHDVYRRKLIDVLPKNVNLLIVIHVFIYCLLLYVLLYFPEYQYCFTYSVFIYNVDLLYAM